jgi:hypothetical protein
MTAAARRRVGLGPQFLIFMAAGALLGAFLGPSAKALQPIGDLFLRLLLMLRSRWSSSTRRGHHQPHRSRHLRPQACASSPTTC